MAKGVAIQRPERWDNPFNPDMSESEVDKIMELDMFRDMDTSKFSETVSLRNIIRNDTRIRHYKQGDIIVRTGDYGTTAFLLISGHVRVILPPSELSETLLGRSEMPVKGFLAALGQLWRNPKRSIPLCRRPRYRHPYGRGRQEIDVPSGRVGGARQFQHQGNRPRHYVR